MKDEGFIAALHERRAPLIDEREGRKGVAVIEAIYRSARSRTIVFVGEWVVFIRPRVVEVYLRPTRKGVRVMTRSIAKIPNDLIGAAGVHFVVSKLTLRGLIALPTIRNTAGIDILVSEPDGRAQANLQVKTSLKKVTFWPTSAPERCLNSSNSFYVFLRYIPEEENFEVFLENSKNVAKQVCKNLEAYRADGRKEFTYWSLPSNQKELQQLRRNWETWRPPKPKKRK